MDIQLFLLLLGGHYLADFPLQAQFMAENKGWVFIRSIGFHTLTAHAAIHGLVAGLLSQSLLIALTVGITHWLIDFGKASRLLTDKYPHTKGARQGGQTHGLYGINIDQLLHVSVILLAVTIWD